MQYNGSYLVKQMTGHAIARNHFTKSQRAAFAAGVACGEIQLTKPTLKLLSKLFNVNAPYIAAALALPPVDREMMRRGFKKIADVPPSKAALKRTVARAGVEPTWEAICENL